MKNACQKTGLNKPECCCRDCMKEIMKSPWLCEKCGFMIDTPNHELGCVKNDDTRK